MLVPRWRRTAPTAELRAAPFAKIQACAAWAPHDCFPLEPARPALSQRERARLRRPTPATLFPEERSCARPPRDDSFVTRAATRSRLLIQARNPAARAPSSDSCSAFVRSVSLATPTSLLCARKALAARPRSLQVRCTRCNGGVAVVRRSVAGVVCSLRWTWPAIAGTSIVGWSARPRRRLRSAGS